MTLTKKPFVDYGKNTPNAPIAVKLSTDERVWLKEAMLLLRQPKVSTALKQLARIGYAQVILDKKTSWILDMVFNNDRRNNRNGIVDVEAEIKRI